MIMQRTRKDGNPGPWVALSKPSLQFVYTSFGVYGFEELFKGVQLARRLGMHKAIEIADVPDPDAARLVALANAMLNIDGAAADKLRAEPEPKTIDDVRALVDKALLTAV